MDLKKLGIRIKKRLSSWLFKWLIKNQPDELRTLIKTVSDEKAQSVALQTTMLYLDRMGFLHCAVCPQRFGLQRTAVADGNGAREIYLCTTHYSQSHASARSNGDGAKLEAL